MGAFAVIILAAVGIITYRLGKSSRTDANLVGNDSDEHGCKLSAGYSWCESKQKCYRLFEEGCAAADDNALIKEVLFKKNDWKESDEITVTVATNDGKYASGTVTSGGGGGYFFAVKDNGVWKIVADGNGVIPCENLANYPDYPKTLIPECWDSAANKSVKR